MGNVAITVNERGVSDNKRWVRGNVEFGSNYAVGGESGFISSALGLDHIDFARIYSNGIYIIFYNHDGTNVGKIQCYYYDNDNNSATSGSTIEIPASTDISGLFTTGLQFFVIGH